MSAPFSVLSVLSVRPVAFGTLCEVSLPGGKAAVDDAIFARLDSESVALARALDGRRQIEFTGGRLAYAHAMQSLGHPAPCLRSGERREPLGPPGFSVSITHKEDVALCLVAEAARGHVGIDLEDPTRNRMRIADKVLREEELAEVQALPEAEQWPRVLLTFAVKEAIYKAIHPVLARYVGFDEARVVVEGPQVSAQLVLKAPAPRLSLEVSVEPLGTRVLAMVRSVHA